MKKENPQKLIEAELCHPSFLEEQKRKFELDIERLILSRKDEFVTVSCPACNSARAVIEFKKYTMTFNRCLECQTIYVSPRPSEIVLTDYYMNAESYAFWAEKIFPASESSRRRKIHEPWYSKIKDYCATYNVQCETLLEIGAGFGTFCKVAQDAGEFENIIAIEPMPKLAEQCLQRGINVLQAPIESISEGLISADIIVTFEVIEHIFNPTEFVRKIYGFLRPGGLLILSCPNGHGFDISILGENSLAVDAEHINLFNPHSLSTLLEKSGFETLEITTPGRLDAEFVRDAALQQNLDLSDNPFLQQVLIDDWDKLGWPFQMFLADNGLSSHMWTVARRPMDL